MERESIKKPALDQALQAAVILLAQREHSQFELQQKLLQRNYPLPLIQQALEKLIQHKLLSEERFVEQYARARTVKGHGPLRIISELQQRGVDAHLINNAIDEFAQEWQALAEQARQKRFGKNPPKNFNEKAKQMRFLHYRGFSTDCISKVFSISSSASIL